MKCLFLSFLLGIVLVLMNDSLLEDKIITYFSLPLNISELFNYLFIMLYAIISYYYPGFVIVMLLVIFLHFSFTNDFWQIMLVITLFSYIIHLDRLSKNISFLKIGYLSFFFLLGYVLTLFIFVFDKTNNTLSLILNYFQALPLKHLYH